MEFVRGGDDHTVITPFSFDVVGWLGTRYDGLCVDEPSQFQSEDSPVGQYHLFCGGLAVHGCADPLERILYAARN